MFCNWSYNEVAQLVGLDSKTVERYIDILEKSYIIFRLDSFSRNLRNECKQSFTPMNALIYWHYAKLKN